MALFDLKAVLDPLAQEVREFGTELLARLNAIGAHLDVANTIAASTNNEAKETNRLLRALVQLNATSTGSVKARILKEALGE